MCLCTTRSIEAAVFFFSQIEYIENLLVCHGTNLPEHKPFCPLAVWTLRSSLSHVTNSCVEFNSTLTRLTQQQIICLHQHEHLPSPKSHPNLQTYFTIDRCLLKLAKL